MKQFDLFPEEKPLPKLGRQQAAILARLRQGEATSVDLNRICFRYGGRIHELRGKGYDIRGERVRKGMWRYWLV